jgi:hypothetical protein
MILPVQEARERYMVACPDEEAESARNESNRAPLYRPTDRIRLQVSWNEALFASTQPASE